MLFVVAFIGPPTGRPLRRCGNFYSSLRLLPLPLGEVAEQSEAGEGSFYLGNHRYLVGGVMTPPYDGRCNETFQK